MDVKEKQAVYHDWESGTYDEKWSISFDERCIDYAMGRFRRVVPERAPFARVLEIGCGTGFFLLNLMQAGVAARGSVTDISPGMVEVALRNAKSLGLDVEGRVADAETIPYDDETFDLVVGHAVLHHIPDVPAAFREVLRVLKPGGVFLIEIGYDQAAAVSALFREAGGEGLRVVRDLGDRDRVVAGTKNPLGKALATG